MKKIDHDKLAKASIIIGAIFFTLFFAAAITLALTAFP